ncbi:putative sulfite oxidase subunit YedZ [Slackia heliotrinireducens]|uniref:Ferric oxidoreductase domain-containing protein n=1 Tax=Slackia heliotrinireducens (strain ATCC 29202 / DSM 20476 / NCTC 11029 / RHS 1) TaxID=471855 RepID=C7N3N1_SLAHD|nr:ferric reductase-like transmembrane domain-containing protein [Slackia heliotrinireducens]ACV21622.1 hypothetical protein Shel_05630 [Slackia heliotrinireducens DSM 20476]VEG99186.1 putative sulfite oxidase subunit YedZ [Slackia heliotrinireducens]
MNTIIILAVTIAACFALRNPIKKAPMAFYVLSVLVVVAFLMLDQLGASRAVRLAFFWTMQKCLVPLALFIVVMYIGVFSRSSKVSLWLRPIRAELSIIAWILSLGHVVRYLQSYLNPLFSGVSLKVNIILGIIVAIVLFILLILLGVTSFRFVKKRMSTDAWKNLQKLAYPFFALTYVHLLFLLMPSAMHGGKAATFSVALYSVIFIAYFILRPLRAIQDRKAASEPAAVEG